MANDASLGKIQLCTWNVLKTLLVMYVMK